MNKYKSYKSSGVDWIGDIPSDWEVSRIKKYFIERNEKVNDIDFPPLSVTKNGVVPQLDNVSKSDNHDDRKKVCTNDFVINSRSDRKGSSGLSRLLGSVSLINIVLEPRNINPSYTEYLFKSYNFIEEFFKNGKGIHWDLWSTRYSELKNIIIPVPTLEEQKVIVNFLDEKKVLIDRLISNKEQKINLLKEQKVSLINHIVTKGLNPNSKMKESGIEWIGEIPKGWTKIKLRYLGELYGGLTGKSGVDFNNDENPKNKPYIPYTNIYNNIYISKNHFHYVSIDEGEKQNLVKKNDLFFLMSSETYQDLGKSCILIDQVDELYLNSFCKGFRVNRKDVNPIFLNYQLSSQTVKELISIEGNGYTRINLRQDRLLETICFIPPIDEQKEIIIFFDSKTREIDNLIQLEQNKISLLKQYKLSLISEVVSGKIKVTH